MRTEIRARMVPEYYNVYIADDDAEFSPSIDCENYEEGQMKIEVEGIVWYDQNGNVLPLTLASWEKVVAIHFENSNADYNLYGILEVSKYHMCENEQAKLSAFNNSPIDYNKPYLILYDNGNEVWENVAEKYNHIKNWLDKI